ncbi:hypothetical protein [Candidatus Spongiisocius sp.]|uniref:hypothetical protein n=1 Tax=Candidatus Spongiisocius sp. TaxID=3101273 RepID=UPI003B5B5549
MGRSTGQERPVEVDAGAGEGRLPVAYAGADQQVEHIALHVPEARRREGHMLEEAVCPK